RSQRFRLHSHLKTPDTFDGRLSVVMSKLRIVYIHGIHNHPSEEEYRHAWDAALERLSYVRDIETKMVYWADIRLGATPEMVREAHARARRHRAHRFGRIRPQTNTPLG